MAHLITVDRLAYYQFLWRATADCKSIKPVHLQNELVHDPMTTGMRIVKSIEFHFVFCR